LLASDNVIEVVGEAAKGEQVIQLYPELMPDVIVMDLSMPGIGGLETIRRMVQRFPQVRILVFSVHHEQVYVERALQAGARGYITKSSATDILVKAIQALMSAQQYVERGLLKSALKSDAITAYQQVIDGFSAREFDIFNLLAQGLTVQKIADQLCLGQKTVANYATQVKKKLQVQSVAELARIAVNLGLML